MSKQRRSHISLMDYLVDYKRFRLFYFIRTLITPPETSTLEQASRLEKGNKSLSNALHPLHRILKDLKDTFKPYKSDSHIDNDLVQIADGVANTFQGIGIIIGTVLFFFYSLYQHLRYSAPGQRKANTLINLKRSGIWLAEGLAYTLQGLIQGITAPLNYCIRMPIRACITAYKGRPQLSENTGVIKLKALMEKNLKPTGLESVDARIAREAVIENAGFELIRKYEKANIQGQKTVGTKSQMRKAWGEVYSIEKKEVTTADEGIEILSYTGSSSQGVQVFRTVTHFHEEKLPAFLAFFSEAKPATDKAELVKSSGMTKNA